MSSGLKQPTPDDLLVEARGLSAEFDKLSQAVAERAGLSTTELLAMDLISRGEPVSAGFLARELRLTTGAVTGLIDRLERAGFAKRVADPNDRRRVIVRPTAKERRIGAFYRPLDLKLRRTIEGYSSQDVATLTDFIRKLRLAVSGTIDLVTRGTG
jgi:DNA-binding MarR family transcriptional regulator